ncbi:MAG: site-specific integrase [Bacteroidales bacterium]|nr:site-specific integrase [Bacteroidales bacterium]
MKNKYLRTKCTVKLQKSKHRKNEFYLLIESYPVFVENSKIPQRQFSSLNRIITTPIWDKERPTRGGKYQPKRNVDGIIQCRSDSDKEACKFAQDFCKIKQSDFDNKALYPELFLQKKEADRKADMDFIEYLRDLIKRRSVDVGEGVHIQWQAMIDRIQDFTGGKSVRIGDLNAEWLEKYRNYLITNKNEKGKTLAPNTQKLYLTQFKTVLIRAYKDEVLTTDLSKKIQPIKGEKSHRVRLTIEELELLAKTPFKNDQVRRAALFSALTGLRHSDIKKLTWDEITGDNTNEPRIEFRQKKTKNMTYLPISPQALKLCGKRQSSDAHVFQKLLPTVHINVPIKAWVEKAEIKKHITFHCFRHTYATLQISSGTDLYTLSKMLGHTNITTTQIYAEVVDPKKQKAANAIKLNINKK